MSAKNIIKEVKRQLGGVSQQRLSELTGFDVDRIKNLEAGRVKKFTKEEIDTIVKITTLSEQEIIISQMAGDDWDKYDSDPINNTIVLAAEEHKNLHLPLVKHIKAQAGANNGMEGIDGFEIIDNFEISKSLLKLPPNGKIRVIEIDGYSMLPMLYPGSFVIFDEHEEWRGDGLYVLNWRNDLMVKLLQVDPFGKLHIKSANKDYDSWTVDPEDQSVFRVIGKVLRVII